MLQTNAEFFFLLNVPKILIPCPIPINLVKAYFVLLEISINILAVFDNGKNVHFESFILVFHLMVSCVWYRGNVHLENYFYLFEASSLN